MATDESDGTNLFTILLLALAPFVALQVVTVSRGQTVAERGFSGPRHDYWFRLLEADLSVPNGSTSVSLRPL